MWREFTREKPAYRSLAIAASALAFVGAMSLAAVLTHDRSGELEVRADAPDWPFTYGLPPGYMLNKVQNESDADEGDPLGRAIYKQGEGPAGRTVVIESYRFDPDISQERIYEKLIGADPEALAPIDFGAEEGQATVRERFGGYELIGVACGPDGVAVSVTVKSREMDPSVTVDFKRICQSVRFKKAGEAGGEGEGRLGAGSNG